ncbi:hypothetical protein Tco_0040961 [Tanacetum coccineum]
MKTFNPSKYNNFSLKDCTWYFRAQNKFEGDNTPIIIQLPCYSASKIPRDQQDDSKQQMTHGLDVDMDYDTSNVEFTEWIATNVFDFETPTCKAFKEFNYLLQVDLDFLTKVIHGFKTYEEYKDDWIYECNKDIPWELAWSIHSWEHTPLQNLEWYEALEDGKLKDKALKNKAIMEGIINEDDESHNEGWRRWDGYTIHDHEERENEEEQENEERCELFDNHHQETPVCKIRRFKIIKYSFGEDEEYVAIKEHEYDDLTSINEDTCREYQEIFCNMDEG